MNPAGLQISAMSALTPKEREGESASLDNSWIKIAVGAFSPFVSVGAWQPGASASPRLGERFSLSLGERATVRTGVKTFCAFLLTGALCLFASASLHAQSYSIDWSTIDGGGGTGTGGVYAVSGSLGQPDAGFSSGGSYTLAGGFWVGESAGPPALQISYASATTVRVWWPSPSAGFVLQVNTSVNHPDGWGAMPAGTVVTDDGLTRSVTVSTVNSPRFYRLRKN